MNDSAKEAQSVFARGIAALSATLLSEADFTAEPVERLDAPEPPTPAERRGHVLALIAAVALHLLIPVSLFLYYWLWPRNVPTAVQEIPVEVVIEQPPPPKPKPKPPEEKPKPPPEPEVEKPAYDAPAAPTEEKVNREVARQEDRGQSRPRGPSARQTRARRQKRKPRRQRPSRLSSPRQRPRRPRTILPLRPRANCLRT